MPYIHIDLSTILLVEDHFTSRYHFLVNFSEVLMESQHHPIVT